MTNLLHKRRLYKSVLTLLALLIGGISYSQTVSWTYSWAGGGGSNNNGNLGAAGGTQAAGLDTIVIPGLQNRLASPTFADIDGDGDQDFISGTRSDNGHLRYYENIGTATSPSWVLASLHISFDTIQFSTANSTSIFAETKARFEDLDNDGDFDLIAAGRYGYADQFNKFDDLWYFENIGTPTAPVFAAATFPPGLAHGVPNGSPLSTNIGEFPTVGFVDLDNDNDLDMVGLCSDSTSYFENTGTANIPNFVRKYGIANPFEAYNHQRTLTSHPVFRDYDNDGDFDLYHGNDDGEILYLENTGTATTPIFIWNQTTPDVFALIGSGLDTMDIGQFACIDFADVTGDGFEDIITGAFQPGVFNWFKATSSCTAATGIDVINNCGPYTWIDGNTYPASNTTAMHTIVGGASNGCDSIVTLSLTVTTAGQVLNVTSANITTTSADISWDALSLPASGSYSIEYRAVGTIPWIAGPTTTSNAIMSALTGLTASTSYEIQVTASCSTGAPGAPSSSHSFSTTTLGCSAVAMSIANNTGSSVTLSWTSVPTVGWYVFRYKESSSSTWISGGSLSGSGTSKIISGLNPSTSYDFESKTFCTDGTASEWSTTLIATTNALTGCSIAPTLSASAITGTSVTMTWSAVSGAGWYVFRYKESTSSNWTSGGSASAAATTKTFSGLNPSVNYDFEGRTYCTNGTASAWGATTFTTITLAGCEVAPILNTTAMATSTSSITISWPAVTGGGWYVFRYKESASSTWLSGGSASGSATSKTYIGLNPGTSYDFQAKTYCSGGVSSAWSSTGQYSTASGEQTITISNSDNGKTTILTEKAISNVNHSNHVYPNPTTGKVNIQTYFETSTENGELILMDMSGRIVRKTSVQTSEGMNNFTMNLQELSTGVYTLFVYQNGSLMHTTKIQKK